MHLSAMVLVAPDVGGVLGVQFPVRLHFSTLFFSFSAERSGDPNDHKLLCARSATFIYSLRYTITIINCTVQRSRCIARK
jgi:hypothetical protein